MMNSQSDADYDGLDDLEKEEYEEYRKAEGGKGQRNRGDSDASSDSDGQGFSAEEQEKFFSSLIENGGLREQEDRIGKILKKTLKIDIDQHLLNLGGFSYRENMFVIDDDFDIPEPEKPRDFKE